MASVKENVLHLFAPGQDDLSADIMAELESMLRVHSISPQELFYKWESYSLRMGSEDTKLELGTVRMFKKDIQDSIETARHVAGDSVRKSVSATPRTNGHGGDNVFGMLDEMTPNAGARSKLSTGKRKADFDSPAPRKVSRPELNGKTTSKPSTTTTHSAGLPFSQRKGAGEILQTFNDHLPASEPPPTPHPESRIKIAANTDMKKFSYKPMSMRQTDSSEILDSRIDDFMLQLQKTHNLSDSAFGSAASQSTSEIIAVGRICADTPETKLNSASIVLEMSRRIGAGLRAPLDVSALKSYAFFPGQIAAFRGVNADGQKFVASEQLRWENLPAPTTVVDTLEATKERLDGSPLSYMVASGPYTADDNLDFEPLAELCRVAAESAIDALILTGPFIDIEHPLIQAGDFDPPSGLSSDESTMALLFKRWISTPLMTFCASVPSATVLLIPSVRDAISKHVSWPQDLIPRAGLGLPKQVKMLTNPVQISLNETLFAASSLDVLDHLRREQLSFGGEMGDTLRGLPRHLVEQQHFFPVYPPSSKGDGGAVGPSLDLGYLKLGEWPNVRPDVLICPSVLTPFVTVSRARKDILYTC